MMFGWSVSMGTRLFLPNLPTLVARYMDRGGGNRRGSVGIGVFFRIWTAARPRGWLDPAKPSGLRVAGGETACPARLTIAFHRGGVVDFLWESHRMPTKNDVWQGYVDLMVLKPAECLSRPLHGLWHCAGPHRAGPATNCFPSITARCIRCC